MEDSKRKELDLKGSEIVDAFREARAKDKTWGALYISSKRNGLQSGTAKITSTCVGDSHTIAFMVYAMMIDDANFAEGVSIAVNEYKKNNN